jgi:lipoate-protein ligase B
MTTDPSIQRAPALIVRDLGRMSYEEAFALQQAAQEAVIAGRTAASGPVAHLLLVEHDPPVITVSRRRGARDHLTASDEQVAAAGVQVVETNRGGDITYHGPGQLVVYAMLDLNVLALRLHGYMRFLESIVIDVLGSFGIEGRSDADAPGVWVGEADSAKVCAMGVRVSRWVSMHGLALNVDPDLSHFDLIVPCGLAGRSVTSMRQLLGAGCPTMEAVKERMVREFRSATGCA